MLTLQEELRNLDRKNQWNFILYKTKGIASNFLQEIPQEEVNKKLEEDRQIDVIDIVYSILVEEFIGKKKDSLEGKTLETNRAVWHLTNLRICNMCYLENFICEYKKYYYKIEKGMRESLGLDDLFFNKLSLGK